MSEVTNLITRHLLNNYGYEGHEILVHPVTGDCLTAEEWADDALDWLITDEYLPVNEYIELLTEQFGNLTNAGTKP